jgi:type III restriction enzyme
MRDLRLVGGFDILFGRLKAFIEQMLFQKPVNLDDLNIVRNLSEVEVTRAILDTFKSAINALTVRDRGTTEIRDRIRFTKVRPHIVNNRPFLVPRKSVFNKVVVDNNLEMAVAQFLDSCQDIVSFVKNSQSTGFRIEYQTAEGNIANYYPDFVVKETESDIWIIETKGREDLEDPKKWERLQQWCQDATAKDPSHTYRALFVRQEKWEEYRPKTFRELRQAFA